MNILKEDEYLDLVDDQDNVIGKELRSIIYIEKKNNFRAITGFIKNKQGKLWIPRRTKDKKIFPLCLDMSVAEHVKSGESYEEGFKRGLQEELNLNIENIEYKVLGKLTPQKGNTACFNMAYEIESDETPNYNRNDFIEYFWLKPIEVLTKISDGDKSKDDLIKLINIFYLNKE